MFLIRQIFRSKIIAMFATLLLSAFVHEYFAAIAIRFVSLTLIVQFAGLGGKEFYHLNHAPQPCIIICY